MTEEIQNTLEQYLAGKLLPNDKQKLEAQIQADPELAEEVRTYVQAHLSIQESGRTILRQQVAESYQNQRQSQVRVRRMSTWITAAAAVIVLLLLFFLPRLGEPEPLDPNALFAEYYQSRSPLQARDGTKEIDYLSEGQRQYENQNYEQAISTLLIAVDSLQGSNQSTAYFFLGQSLLESGKAQEAIEAFEQVEGNFYRPDAEWNIALSHLKLGQLDSTKHRLRILLNKQNNARASQLLEQLDP